MSLDLNLGIDFGTSFTKVCVRNTALESSWIVTFDTPDSLEEALLPTRIGICHDGQILAGLTQSEWQDQDTSNYMAINFIKMRLANLYLRLDQEGWQFPCSLAQSIAGVDLSNAEITEDLCAYYLSRVISQAKDWIHQHNADLVRNQEIRWSVNIGVPVQYADSEAISGFRSILYLACFLEDLNTNYITVNHLSSALSSFKQELVQHLETLFETLKRFIAIEENISSFSFLKLNFLQIFQPPLPECFAIPEVAAAVYSYTTSRQAEPGTYIFFDIGSGTIEGASFRFWYENEMPKIDFYVGEVRPLGVHALIKQTAASINTPTSEAELEANLIQDSTNLLRKIADQSARLCFQSCLVQGDIVVNRWQPSMRSVLNQLQRNPSQEEEQIFQFILRQRDIHQQVGTVIMRTKVKNPDYYHTSIKLPVFIGGGGSAIQFYLSTISDTYDAFNHCHAGVPPYHLRTFPVPKDLKKQTGLQEQFHRFAVAYGLSIPEYEMPEVRLPRLFPEQKLPKLILSLGSSTDGEYIN